MSSAVTMSKPTISRWPWWLTAVAMTAETLTTRPASRTFCVKRVHPNVTIRSTVQGPVPEGGHLGVELGRHTGDLRAGDPVDAHGFDQVIDPAGGHALDIGLADHRHQGLLGPPAGRSSQSGK